MIGSTLSSSVIVWLVWVSAAGAGVLCVLRGWSRRVLAARSRTMLITGLVDAAVLLALVRALVPPPGPASWLWVLACGCIGVGVAGAIRRWAGLPAVTPRTNGQPRAHPRLRAGLMGLYAVIGLGLVAALG